MRLLFLAVAATAILIGGAAATLAISDHSLALAGSMTSAAPAVALTRTTENVAGPCDEAEHANDARCAATTTSTTTKATRREDGAGHRRRGRHGRSGASRSASGPTGVDNSDHGGDDNSEHHGGGHGRDHAEDD
jgi:hypothetical protein